MSRAALGLPPDDVDGELLWSLFERFVAADTCARVDENRIAPDDARLVTFAHEVAGPALAALGADVRVDELSNVVARFGQDVGTELLLVSYPAVHHGQQMSDPLAARRFEHAGEQVWAGMGASQSKGALASVCSAARLLLDRGVDLAGRLAIAVCSEGSSSHVSSSALFAGFEHLPAGAVLTVGTGGAVSLGNRGRVDVVIEIHGRATHSSSPERGSNPIPLVSEALARLGGVELDKAPHPLLGPRALTPYKLVCGPVAPHTIPERCTLVLDRRILPGDEPGEAVAEVAEALAGLPVTVTQGATMLPALVEADAAVVRALQAGAHATLGRRLQTFYPPYTFDAGHACALGVPAVMFGPSSSDFGGAEVLGDDVVLERHLREAAAVYAGAVVAMLE